MRRKITRWKILLIYGFLLGSMIFASILFNATLRKVNLKESETSERSWNFLKSHRFFREPNDRLAEEVPIIQLDSKESHNPLKTVPDEKQGKTYILY